MICLLSGYGDKISYIQLVNNLLIAMRLYYMVRILSEKLYFLVSNELA